MQQAGPRSSSGQGERGEGDQPTTSGCGGGGATVFLNVYDLVEQNHWTYWCGVGIFHSGVEVYGIEYAFGGHEYDGERAAAVPQLFWAGGKGLLGRL